MKKVLTIITILVILLSIGITSNAAIEITEEKLEESFNKMMENPEDSEGSANYSFNKEKDMIVMNEDGNIYELYYNLEDKPKFYIEMKFEKSMTKEEADEELSKALLPVIGFALTNNIMDINFEDSVMYFFSKSLESSVGYDNNQTIEYTNGIEYVKKIYPNENYIFNDKLFNLTLSKQQETDAEYILMSELTVNADEDFSILNGYAEKNGEEFADQLVGSLGNAFNDSNSTNVNKENLEDTNNIVANIQKIPQTGNEISLQKILYSVIVIATLLGVCLAIYNKKH